MGTWGPGNFESDSASEFLDKVLDDLATTIRTCMDRFSQADHHWFYEYYGQQKLIPAIDLIITICKSYDFMVASFIRPDEVTRWQNDYFYIYDRIVSDFISDTNMIIQYRKKIEAMFIDLKRLADDE